MTTKRNAETDLCNAVRVIFETGGTCRLWRNNNGAVRAHGRMIRYGLTPGSADLLGLARGGRFVSVEVKTPGGRTSKERELLQDEWAYTVRTLGGYACQVSSVDEARAAKALLLSDPLIGVNAEEV